MFQVNLVGVQKPVLNSLEEWISRIFKNLKEFQNPWKYKNQSPFSVIFLVMIWERIIAGIPSFSSRQIIMGLQEEKDFLEKKLNITRNWMQGELSRIFLMILWLNNLVTLGKVS